MKYKCSICGKEYSNLDNYLKCVSNCVETKKKSNERLNEINAALNGVKQAKLYYEQKLKEFKENYPDEYKINFESESKIYDTSQKIRPEDLFDTNNSEKTSEFFDTVNDFLDLFGL